MNRWYLRLAMEDQLNSRWNKYLGVLSADFPEFPENKTGKDDKRKQWNGWIVAE